MSKQKPKKSTKGNWTPADKKQLALELGHDFYSDKDWIETTGKEKPKIKPPIVLEIKYYNAKKGFKLDSKTFEGNDWTEAFKKATTWGRTNIENFNMDMIHHISGDLAGLKSNTLHNYIMLAAKRKKKALSGLDFEAVTNTDIIGDFIRKTRFKTASFERFADRNHLKGRDGKTIRLKWLSAKGTSIDTVASDFKNEFPHISMDEQEVIEEIVNFIVGNPSGYGQYARKRMDELNAEIEEMERMAANRGVDVGVDSEDAWQAFENTKLKPRGIKITKVKSSKALRTKRQLSKPRKAKVVEAPKARKPAKKKTVKQVASPELSAIRRFHNFHGKTVSIKQLESLVGVLTNLVKRGSKNAHFGLLKTIKSKLMLALFKLTGDSVTSIKNLSISKDLLRQVEFIVNNPKITSVTLGNGSSEDGKWIQLFEKQYLKYNRGVIVRTPKGKGYTYFIKTESIHNQPVSSVEAGKEAIDLFNLKKKGKSSIGGTQKLSRSQKQYNKEVDLYKWFVVNTSTKKAISGFEYKQDAIDLLNDFDGDKNIKVITKSSLKKFGIADPINEWKGLSGDFTAEQKLAIKEAENDVKDAAERLKQAKKRNLKGAALKPYIDGHQKYIDRLAKLKANLPKANAKDRSQTELFKDEKSLALFGIETYTLSEAKALGIIDHKGNNLAGIEPKAKNPYDVINRIIIKQINSGVVPWEQPWTMDKGKSIKPQNLRTKREYRGVNFWELMCEMDLRGHNVPYFLTKTQIDEKGGKLVAGAKPYYVTYYGKFVKTEDKPNKETGEIVTEESLIKFLKLYAVYNVADMEDVKYPVPDNKPAKEVQRIATAEAILKNMPKKPTIKFGGNQAFYSPSQDLVQMPNIENFKQVDRYYSTFFHELVHSTKHNKRCGTDNFRKNSLRHGDKQYSWEELVAELGACYLSGEAGILHKTVGQSAAYAKGWANSLVKYIHDDKTYFFKAAAYAQKAADFILDKSEDETAKKGVDKKPSNKVMESQKAHATKSVASVKKKSTLKGLETPTPKTKNPFATMDKLVSGGTYELQGELGKLIGNLGNVDSSITIKGDQGAGKSQLMWMLVNAFASIGKRVAVVSAEMNGNSPTISKYRDKYISKENQDKILFTDKKLSVKEIKDLSAMFDVVFVDSFNQLQDYKQEQFEWLCKQVPDKCIVGLFQSTTNGEMRGGNKPEFDAYVNIEVVKVDDTFVNNYAVCTKNRFGGTGARFNISKQKIQQAISLKGLKKHKRKSAACNKVLKMMDKDYSYQDALKIVLGQNKRLTKASLEKELDYYV